MTEQKYYRPLDEAQLIKDDPRNLGDVIVDKITVNETLTQTGAVALASTLAVTGTTTLAGILQSVVKIPDAATYAVLAANSGKVHIVPDLGQDCTITLPTPAANLHYRFIYGGVAADTNGPIIKTGSNTNFFKGGITWLDSDATDNEVVSVYPNGSSNAKLTIKPGDAYSVEMFCDGTNWYISGTVTATATPAFADT